jgi:hypothetical protein
VVLVDEDLVQHHEDATRVLKRKKRKNPSRHAVRNTNELSARAKISSTTVLSRDREEEQTHTRNWIVDVFRPWFDNILQEHRQLPGGL